MTKKNNCATIILTVLCSLFAFVSTARAEGWRVIAEDPQFPTDDVIVAFCSVADSRPTNSQPIHAIGRLHACDSTSAR